MKPSKFHNFQQFALTSYSTYQIIGGNGEILRLPNKHCLRLNKYGQTTYKGVTYTLIEDESLERRFSNVGQVQIKFQKIVCVGIQDTATF